MQRVALALALTVALGVGALVGTAVGDPVEWTHDPDSEVEAIWQDVEALKARADRIERLTLSVLVPRETRLFEAKAAQRYWRSRVADAGERARIAEAGMKRR